MMQLFSLVIDSSKILKWINLRVWRLFSPHTLRQLVKSLHLFLLRDAFLYID